MVYDFDGKRYKKSSKHQKEWGNKIIKRTKQEDGTYFETFRRINILAEKV